MERFTRFVRQKSIDLGLSTSEASKEGVCQEGNLSFQFPLSNLSKDIIKIRGGKKWCNGPPRPQIIIITHHQ